MAKENTIPNTSTLATLPIKDVQKREEYVRLVVANFYASKLDLRQAVVRIGVQGEGDKPHYKIEYPESTIDSFGEKKSAATFKIYHGANHEEMTAFTISQLKPENWSANTMSFQETSEFLGVLRKSR